MTEYGVDSMELYHTISKCTLYKWVEVKPSQAIGAEKGLFTCQVTLTGGGQSLYVQAKWSRNCEYGAGKGLFTCQEILKRGGG